MAKINASIIKLLVAARLAPRLLISCGLTMFNIVKTGRKRWFWAGFGIGIIYFSRIFSWFWAVYPLDSLGFEGKISPFLAIFIVFAITVAVLAFFWGIFGWFLFKFTRPPLTRLTRGLVRIVNLAFLPFVAAGGFVVTEYLRAWFFGILWWGNGSALGAHWTFGNPAYWFAPLSFIFKTLSVWGIYGLDFILALAAVSLFLFFKTQVKIFAAEFLAIAMFVISMGIFATPPAQIAEKKISVSVIQTAYPTKTTYQAEEILKDFGEKLKLLKQAASEKSGKQKIIIFPEGADFSKTLAGFLDTISVKNFFNKLSDEEILIVDNNKVSDEAFKSKTIFTGSESGIIGYYDKRLLSPGGEFLPYIVKWPLSFLNPSLKKEFEASREFAKGKNKNIIAYKNLRAKILVCSDIVSPSMARSGNFDLILAQNSFGIFHGSPILQDQLLAMARARTVENSKYLVFASNFGRSFILNPAGNIEKMAANTGYEILTGDIAPNSRRTWYNKLGDWPILILSLLLVFFAVFPKFSGRSLKKNAD